MTKSRRIKRAIGYAIALPFWAVYLPIWLALRAVESLFYWLMHDESQDDSYRGEP